MSNRFQTSYCARSAHVKGQLNRFFFKVNQARFCLQLQLFVQTKVAIKESGAKTERDYNTCYNPQDTR